MESSLLNTMKNDKICFSKKMVVIVPVLLFLIAVVLFTNYMNGQKYSISSRASAPPAFICDTATTLITCDGGAGAPLPYGYCSPAPDGKKEQYICDYNAACKGEWKVDTRYRCLGDKYPLGFVLDKSKVIFEKCIADKTYQDITTATNTATNLQYSDALYKVKSEYAKYKSCKTIDPIVGIPPSDKDICTVDGKKYPIGYCSSGANGKQYICMPHGDGEGLWSGKGSDICGLKLNNGEIKSGCMAVGMEQYGKDAGFVGCVPSFLWPSGALVHNPFAGINSSVIPSPKDGWGSKDVFKLSIHARQPMITENPLAIITTDGKVVIVGDGWSLFKAKYGLSLTNVDIFDQQTTVPANAYGVGIDKKVGILTIPGWTKEDYYCTFEVIGSDSKQMRTPITIDPCYQDHVNVITAQMLK